MATVFLSYDRADGERAQAVVAALESAGHAVWWDRQIRPGAEFAQAIEDALARADAVVVLWSEQSVRSAWVRDEAAHGRDSGRLVPVTLDKTPPPLGFRQYQAIALSGPGGMPALLAAVAGLADDPRGADAGTPPLSAPPPRTPRRRRKPWVAWAGLAAALAVVVGVAVGWVAIRDRSEASPAEVQRRSGETPATSTEALTLAVLPFDDLTGAPARSSIAEGLSRDLRNRLSRLRGLRVLAETSSFAAANAGAAPLELGRRLGADYLLDGSLQGGDGALRVTIELVDARTGLQVWTDSEAVAANDPASAQEQVSAMVIQELISRLGPDRVQQTAAPPTPSPGGRSPDLAGRGPSPPDDDGPRGRTV